MTRNVSRTMEILNYDIPAGARPVVCKGEGCKQTIYWIETDAGKRMPVNADGSPHWGTCPDAGRFKKGAAK